MEACGERPDQPSEHGEEAPDRDQMSFAAVMPMVRAAQRVRRSPRSARAARRARVEEHAAGTRRRCRSARKTCPAPSPNTRRRATTQWRGKRGLQVRLDTMPKAIRN